MLVIVPLARDTMVVVFLLFLVQPVVQTTTCHYWGSWDEHGARLCHEHGAYLLSCQDISEILTRLFYDIFLSI